MTASAEFSSYGGRETYNQTREDELIMCNFLTDILDDLMATPVSVGSDIKSAACFDETGAYISRSFRYIESDRPYGWAWPLVETSVDILYQRDVVNNTSETYRVHIGTLIHQQGATHDPIPNIYEIVYYGSDRQSVVATIEAPNLTEPDQADFTTRETTPYDQEVLFNTLVSLQEMIDIHDRESALESSLAKNR